MSKPIANQRKTAQDKKNSQYGRNGSDQHTRYNGALNKFIMKYIAQSH
jgi:hypothetical protein